MRRRYLIIFILFLLAAGGVVGSQYLFHWSRGTLLNPAPPLQVTVLYSGELGAWLQPATDQFNAAKKKLGDQVVQVTIRQADDGQALNDIAAGKSAPTAWIPASSIWVNLLNSQWRQSHQADLLLRSGEYGTVPMCLTPMVFVMYADRAAAFTSKFKNVDWQQIQQAVADPAGWKNINGNEDWGHVKYGQTDPSNSNAGLLAVTLATYTYYNKTTGLTSTNMNDAAYLTWMQGLASGLVANAPPTAGQQMDDMLRYGASRYDVVSIYESLVAQQIKNAQGRFGTDLKVFYPKLNIWSDYPFSILVGDQSSADQKDAALLFERYLYSAPVQNMALYTGFRPANPDVPLVTTDPNNPFNKYAGAGLQINIPRTVLADPPSGDVLASLRRIFAR